MREIQVTRTFPFAVIAAFAALSVAERSFAQTIPMSHYTFTGSRGTYSGVLVGGNPFLANPTPVTIDAVLISLVIRIIQPDGKVVLFDPTAPDSCDLGGFSAQYRFRHSPLVDASDLTFNGVSVGSAQYIDGFMRAEFWNEFGSNPSYTNHLNWSFASALPLPPLTSGVAIVEGTGSCSDAYRGILSQIFFNTYMNTVVIPALQAAKVISPTKFAFFLTKNVVTSNNPTPTTSNIKGGQHYKTGSPVQTWARAAYTLGGDVKTASHEIGEWMNDPLVNNPTPPWGYIGSFPKGCSSILEVGDPLNGKGIPVINMNDYPYHVQELAFFSWFYAANGDPSLGADGKFSSHGTFTGPSMNCPPGGTF
jgi:hypothetical protein